MCESASRVDGGGVHDDSCAVSKGSLGACATLALALGCQSNGEAADPVALAEPSKQASPPLLSRTRPLMSTVFRIQVDSPPSNAENVIRQAFEEIEHLETALSEWREESDISKVNALAGKKSVKVGDDTLRVVDAGVDV